MKLDKVFTDKSRVGIIRLIFHHIVSNIYTSAPEQTFQSRLPTSGITKE